jgi:hypothetical protein
MDPALIATSYASIIGLVCNFISGRDQKKSAELGEFLEWLIRHGHEETRRLVESSHATTVSLKAILNSGHDEILSRLCEIELSLVALSGAHGAFAELAKALHPDNGLSDQSCEVLMAFEHAGAGRALELSTYDGKSLIFMDGTRNSQFSPRDPRFYEADIDELVRSGLLLLSHNAKGGRVLTLTRTAAKLAAILIERQRGSA